MEEHLRILVIDDSMTVSRYLKHLLSRMGHEVILAGDGNTGLQRWQTERFDLILLDLMLPDLSGLDVLQRIRATDQETCVVMVTGHGDVATAIEAVRQGADNYVEKSQITLGSGLDEFLHVIYRAMEIREAQVSRLRLEQEIRQKNQELEATVRELQRTQQALVEERNKLQQILFSLSELVLVVDREGRVILINPLAAEDLGVAQDAAIDRPLRDLGAHPDVVQAVQWVLSTGEVARLEVPSLRQTNGAETGQLFSALLNPVYTHNGEPLGVAVVLRDVTRERELEQMKADFYSMITHDLRSPATAITGFVELLAEEAVGPLNDAQKEIVAILRRSIDKQLRLINDFLDYSAIDAGFLKLEKQETDVRNVVEEALREIQPLADQKRHTVSAKLPDGPFLAYVDGERLNQVVVNLLTNAVKYTPDGGHIEVRLTGDDGTVRIEVSDIGIGISEQQLPLLFSKYKRLPGETGRKIQGTGLGLLIVKEIVTAHGGEITVESTPGQGSTFRVVLPRYGS